MQIIPTPAKKEKVALQKDNPGIDSKENLKQGK